MESDWYTGTALAADRLATADRICGPMWDLAFLRLRHDYLSALREPDSPVVTDLRTRCGRLASEADSAVRVGWARLYLGLIADNLAGERDVAPGHYHAALEAGLTWEALRHLGDHDRDGGDPESAARRWEQSAESAAREGRVPGTLAQQLLLAVLARDNGDASGAARLAGEVARWAGALGMTRLADQAESFLAAPPAAISPPSARPASVAPSLDRASAAYRAAVYGGDAGGLADAERHLEADAALARGRLLHARFLNSRVEDPAELPLFERAAGLYQALGDQRGEAEARFWIGCVHQVIRRDDTTAVPLLESARRLAARAGDRETLAEALRHLGIAAHAAGRLDEARNHLEESSRLRGELGCLAGVAANMVGLAYIAAAQGRDATAILDEAARIARSRRAHRIVLQIDEARRSL